MRRRMIIDGSMRQSSERRCMPTENWWGKDTMRADASLDVKIRDSANVGEALLHCSSTQVQMRLVPCVYLVRREEEVGRTRATHRTQYRSARKHGTWGCRAA